MELEAGVDSTDVLTPSTDAALFPLTDPFIPFSGPFRLAFPEVLEWNDESWFWAGGANSGGIPSNGGKKGAPARE